MGTHNPGMANEYIKEADLVSTLGCSLLQHQIENKVILPKSKLFLLITT